MKALMVFAVITLSGCVSLQTSGALAVSDVTSDMTRFNGKTVRIRGWIDRCENLSCGLFASKEAAIQRQYGEHMLSIGSNPEFDDQAVGRGPAEVILVARVSDRCRTRYICMDRASELVPLAVRFLRKS